MNKSIVYIQNCDYDSADYAIENIFKKFPLDVKGKLVWVKPNMLGDFIPARHITTHPAIVSAIVKRLDLLEAKVVVGDNPGVQSMLSDSYVASKTGILESSCGKFQDISKKTVSRTLGGGFDETVLISKIAIDCDIMISVPKMKTHLQTMLTGAIKNSYGLIVGMQKPKLHMKYSSFEDFAALVGEIFNLRRPDLVIMDAVYVMEGDGPNSSMIRPFNKIIASEDAVALDHYIARTMGMDVNRIPLLRYCAKNKFGCSLWDLHGDGDEVIKDFKLPKTYFGIRRKNSFIETMLYHFIINKKITISREKCSKCKKCLGICPTGAIGWKDGPVIDSKKCILCFCCKEICEQRAIVFARRYVYAQKIVQGINYLYDQIAERCLKRNSSKQ